MPNNTESLKLNINETAEKDTLEVPTNKNASTKISLKAKMQALMDNQKRIKNRKDKVKETLIEPPSTPLESPSWQLLTPSYSFKTPTFVDGGNTFGEEPEPTVGAVDKPKSPVVITPLSDFPTDIRELQDRLAKSYEQIQEAERTISSIKSEHEERIFDIQITLETAVLDKEYAEESLKLLQEKIEQLEGGSTDQPQTIENVKLKEALFRLKDASEKDVESYKLKIAALESENNQIEGYKQKIEDFEEQVGILLEQLQLAEESEDVIEKLSSKNLQLTEELEELNDRLKASEELKDYSDQLQAFNEEEITLLKFEVEKKDEELLAFKQNEQVQREAIAAKEKAINNFRAKCTQLNQEIQNVRASQSGEVEAADSMREKTSKLMHMYHKVQNKLKNAKAQVWELELREVNSRIIDRYCVQAVERLIPENVVEEDVRALKSYATLQSMINKFEMISSIIGGEYKFSMDDDDKDDNNNTLVQPENQKNDKNQQFAQVYTNSLLCLGSFLLKIFQHANTTSSTKFLKCGRFLSELLSCEMYIDKIMDAIKQQDLKELTFISHMKPYLLKISSLSGHINTTSWGAYLSEDMVQMHIVSDEILNYLDEKIKNTKAYDIKNIYAVMKQSKEEHTQLLQYYKKFNRVLVDYEDVQVTHKNKFFVHEWIMFAFLCHKITTNKLSCMINLLQEVKMGLLDETLTTLRDIVYKKENVGFVVCVSLESLNSLNDTFSCYCTVLDIGDDQTEQMIASFKESPDVDMIPSDLSQSISKNISDVCEEIISTGHNQELVDVDQIMSERALIVRQESSSHH
ncbi:dynactin subunit 1 [Acrasis kona]|uniref:Dynactin subunit 1 n=1 Tax=Acrasis kona TaxID=1008807 RepID=A0AAW2Z0S6_9EUKA